jgi:putative ABC transport system permease protein
MSLREAIDSAVASLSAHKLRSGLTMLGMLFGVGAVIAMLSIGAGAERQALAMIEALGLRNIYVKARPFTDEELAEIRKKSTGLCLRDARALQEAVPHVLSVSPRIRLEPYKVFSATGHSKPAVLGVSHDYAATAGLRLVQGRFFGAPEETASAQVCVLGARSARELFGYDTPLGRDVKVDDVWLTVIGVLGSDTPAQEIPGAALESTAGVLLLPVTTARRKFEKPPLKDDLDEIRITLDASADPVETAAVVENLFDRLHGGAEDTTLTIPEALLEQSRRTQRLFSIVMGCIAGISLLVGGIGIMNIMLATVLERTTEIGLRRAVGARRRDIRSQFLIEAFALSLLGGVAGVAMGLAISRGVAAYAGWPTVVTPGSILLATGVSLAVGLVFGMYPAWRAAELDPIVALHYE